VAVIGRSNVGKSSLLNVLTGSSGLARVSDKPGRTTQLCWFEIGKRGNPDAFYLVDMPGYGFALASEKSVEQWAELSAAYLRKRSTLKLVLVLIDSRVGMKLTDVQARRPAPRGAAGQGAWERAWQGQLLALPMALRKSRTQL
jgi:GTP-binding protein